MTPDQRSLIRKLKKAAEQRLEAAVYLMEGRRFNRDAFDLSGYSVELSLRAAILSATPLKKYSMVWDLLAKQGAKGHDFEYLKDLFQRIRFGLRLRGEVKLPKDRVVFERTVRENWMRVATWSTSFRYEVGYVATEDAEAFLTAARSIMESLART
ncbi:MAG: HEPN domain-containing protein [Gemmataceae bacterium]|nr:HEPN domain-containing protein [Gemmataceae bacterium]